MSEAIFDTYNNRPVLRLKTDTDYTWTFGIGKAKLFLKYMKSIRDFVNMVDRKVKEFHDKKYYREESLQFNFEDVKYPFYLNYYRCRDIIANEEVIKSFINKYK
jgi:hypothetical protein